MKEELGIRIKKCFFVGGSEHTFIEDGIKHHEINLAFWVPMKKREFKSKENHLKFYLLNKNQIKKQIILPMVLKNALLKWQRNKKPFWISQI